MKLIPLLPLFLLLLIPSKAQSILRIGDSTRDLPVSENLILEKIAGGDYDGCEGPLWVDDSKGGFLLYGAVHTNIAFRWRESTGPVEFRNPSHEASAFKPDPERPGAFIVAEQTTRRIVRYEVDGSTSIIADNYKGKAFNRPNDLAIYSDGSIWFTDPDYLFKQRPHETKELSAQHIFRIDSESDQVTSMDASLSKPNGIAFSKDEKTLYVSDSATHFVYQWPILRNGRLGKRSIFVELPESRLDGIQFDAKGNLWVAAATSVYIVAPSGEVFAKIPLPLKPTAIAFGGEMGNTPYLTTRQAVFRLASQPR